MDSTKLVEPVLHPMHTEMSLCNAKGYMGPLQGLHRKRQFALQIPVLLQSLCRMPRRGRGIPSASRHIFEKREAVWRGVSHVSLNGLPPLICRACRDGQPSMPLHPMCLGPMSQSFPKVASYLVHPSFHAGAVYSWGLLAVSALLV